MNSKRGQSEIITTVLIILLVLAAIIIVWQVVQGTLKQGQSDIDKKKDCLGLEIVTLSAVASKGTCNYAVGGVGCTVVNVALPCPVNTTCTTPTFAETTAGNVLIRREGTSVAKNVKTQLIINNKVNQSRDTILDTSFATDTYTVTNLAVDADVQLTPLLSDGTACGLTEKVKVTPV